MRAFSLGAALLVAALLGCTRDPNQLVGNLGYRVEATDLRNEGVPFSFTVTGARRHQTVMMMLNFGAVPRAGVAYRLDSPELDYIEAALWHPPDGFKPEKVKEAGEGWTSYHSIRDLEVRFTSVGLRELPNHTRFAAHGTLRATFVRSGAPDLPFELRF